MKDALSFIIASIVENEDKISISEEEKDGATNFSITVAKEDVGRIIGKSGKVIRAIRNVIKIPAIKQGKKIYISVSES